jgi:hypothetical protein
VRRQPALDNTELNEGVGSNWKVHFRYAPGQDGERR